MNFSTYPIEEEDSDESYISNEDEEADEAEEEADEAEEEEENEWIDGSQIEEIANLEYEIPYQECNPDQYYIGTFKYLELQNILLFAKKIHLSTFYKYSKQQLSEYLYWYSGIYICDKPRLEILQLKVDPQGVYSCIIKTFWIKIIQRKWKAAFHKEKDWINRNILSILNKRERTSKPIFMTKLRGLLI